MNSKIINKKKQLPPAKEIASLLHKVIDVLLDEDQSYRPYFYDEIGSFLEFHDSIPIIIVPDLHARYDFLIALLNFKIEEKTVRELLEEEKLRLFFVGDGLHTEITKKERWQNAFDLYLKGNFTNTFIKEEMAEGLDLMCEIMRLKIAYPSYVHFLKGNHENILNEESNGNFPFGKHVMEGEMVKSFMLSHYGSKIINLYAKFEHLLPLFVSGKGFLISHAEPDCAYSKEELITAKHNPDVVRGLTWTKNNQVSGEAVKTLLNQFQSTYPHAVYFVGHRYVEGKVAYRAGGRLVQIHNPFSWQFVYLKPGDMFDEKTDIIVLKNNEELWQK